MEHPLAVAVEAKMPGLDDPGMHRADRDFVDFGPGNLEEIDVSDGRAAAAGSAPASARDALPGGRPIARGSRARSNARRGNRGSATDRRRRRRSRRGRSRRVHRRPAPPAGACRRASCGNPISSNSRQPVGDRGEDLAAELRRCRRRESPRPRTGTALPVVSKVRHSRAPRHRGGAAERAGEPQRHPQPEQQQQAHRRRRRSSTADRAVARRASRHRLRHRRRPCRSGAATPTRRRRCSRRGTAPAPARRRPPTAARSSWYSLMKIENGATPISARTLPRSAIPHSRSARSAPDSTCMSWLPKRCPSRPTAKKRQRLAHRVVERVEQRGKGAERAEPEAEGDDAEMLDAVIGEQALGIALKDDEARPPPGSTTSRRRSAGRRRSRRPGRAAPAARSA